MDTKHGLVVRPDGGPCKVEVEFPDGNKATFLIESDSFSTELPIDYRNATVIEGAAGLWNPATGAFVHQKAPAAEAPKSKRRRPRKKSPTPAIDPKKAARLKQKETWIRTKNRTERAAQRLGISMQDYYLARAVRMLVLQDRGWKLDRIGRKFGLSRAGAALFVSKARRNIKFEPKSHQPLVIAYRQTKAPLPTSYYRDLTASYIRDYLEIMEQKQHDPD